MESIWGEPDTERRELEMLTCKGHSTQPGSKGAVSGLEAYSCKSTDNQIQISTLVKPISHTNQREMEKIVLAENTPHSDELEEHGS